MVVLASALLCCEAKPSADASAAAAAMERARQALAAQDYAGAIADLEAAQRFSERQGAEKDAQSEIAHDLIICYQKVGDEPRAMAAAQRHLERYPDDAAILELVGKLHYIRGSYEDAARAFEKLKRLVTPTPRLLRQLVSVHVNRRSQTEALATVGELLSLDRSADSLELALEAYMTFFQHEEAIEIVEELRRLRGARPMYGYAAGFAHSKLDHRAEAERELRRLLDDPVYGDDARFELGMVLGKQRERLPEAMAIFAGLLERDPYYAQAYFQLSQLLFRQRLREEGQRLREIHEALQKSEDEFAREREFAAAGLSVDAAIVRALGYQRRQQYRKAEVVLRAELERWPGDERLLGALGDVLFVTDRCREAEEVLRRAESTADVQQKIGLSLWRQGRAHDAYAYFESLSRLPEAAVMARAHLGRICLEEHKDPDRALQVLEPAVEKNPELSALVSLIVARAHCERGTFPEAEAVCGRLICEKEPVGSEARLYLAWCEAQTGDASRALALLDEVRGAFRGSGRYFSVKAMALEGLNDSRAAEYREWESTITRLEEEARRLEREVAVLGWPDASAKLLLLAENARQRRKERIAYHYALLAAEADPDSAEALRSLLQHPLTDFVKLSVLGRLSRLAPQDASVTQQIAELREKYGLD